ncbi:MAG: hypothetical protein OXH92_17845, partial [Bryobacterales bacterium]|nr:hypothetical protein [Bryobacterales bacterium]
RQQHGLGKPHLGQLREGLKKRGPACISHHPTAEAREKKAVIRVSCLVIRENHWRGLVRSKRNA